MVKDIILYKQGEEAIAALARNRRQRGSYHIVRDPEGVVSMWAVDGMERASFAITFGNAGRVSGRLDDMPPEFVRALINYIKSRVNR